MGRFAKVLALPALLASGAAAQHFGVAAIEVRLLPPDSVRVSIEVDAQDMMNSVFTFPYYADTGEAAYRLYELRLEQYMQAKVKLRADGKPVYLAATQWKRDGKGRHDGLDSISIQTEEHYIGLAGKLPKKTRRLTLRANIWEEREEVEQAPAIELSLTEGEDLLKYFVTRMGVNINLHVHPDSVAKMRANPPRNRPKAEVKRPHGAPHDANDGSDHSGHNH